MVAHEPTAAERFLNGIIPENPVYRQLLGMCPTLAVTGAMKPAMTMAAATAFVLICANIMISLIRGVLKPHLRILVFTLTIATFVTIADRLLAAYMYQMSKQLGPYVPLIIVNCLIISRCEICASKQSVGIALADASRHVAGLRAGTGQHRHGARDPGLGHLVWLPRVARSLAGLGDHGPAAGRVPVTLGLLLGWWNGSGSGERQGEIALEGRRIDRRT